MAPDDRHAMALDLNVSRPQSLGEGGDNGYNLSQALGCLPQNGSCWGIEGVGIAGGRSGRRTQLIVIYRGRWEEWKRRR